MRNGIALIFLGSLMLLDPLFNDRNWLIVIVMIIGVFLFTSIAEPHEKKTWWRLWATPISGLHLLVLYLVLNLLIKYVGGEELAQWATPISSILVGAILMIRSAIISRQNNLSP
jgi:hypothetical protein